MCETTELQAVLSEYLGVPFALFHMDALVHAHLCMNAITRVFKPVTNLECMIWGSSTCHCVAMAAVRLPAPLECHPGGCCRELLAQDPVEPPQLSPSLGCLHSRYFLNISTATLRMDVLQCIGFTCACTMAPTTQGSLSHTERLFRKLLCRKVFVGRTISRQS